MPQALRLGLVQVPHSQFPIPNLKTFVLITTKVAGLSSILFKLRIHTRSVQWKPVLD